ncbi:MAG: hypothetical protein F4Y53_02180 [Proteobacteria bacterium]|nr:hypothetical protein [Pseudomonadota bacterium]
MPKALSAEDERFLRDFLDLRSGEYLLTTDTLLFLWRDEIPRDKLSALGVPLPKVEYRSPDNKEVEDLRLTVIRQWVMRWRFDRHRVEALQRLLKVLVEHDRPIPEPLQAWAFQMAIEAKVPRPQGRQPNLEINWRIYSAFRFLTQDKHFSNNAAYKLIAEKTCRSPETIKSTVREKKALFLKMLNGVEVN